MSFNLQEREIRNSIVTGRDPKAYQDAFNFKTVNDLAGKRILEIGSGRSKFAKFVNSSGLAEVVTVDPRNTDLPRSNGKSVAAVAQYLPFGDQVFHKVIALYSIYWIFLAREQAIAEMLRTTRPEGVVQIFPATPKGGFRISEMHGCISLIQTRHPVDQSLNIRRLACWSESDISMVAKYLCANISFSAENEEQLFKRSVESHPHTYPESSHQLYR